VANPSVLPPHVIDYIDARLKGVQLGIGSDRGISPQATAKSFDQHRDTRVAAPTTAALNAAPSTSTASVPRSRQPTENIAQLLNSYGNWSGC
jgi:hypothetical protein